MTVEKLVRSEASKACFLCDLYGEPCSKEHDLVPESSPQDQHIYKPEEQHGR